MKSKKAFTLIELLVVIAIIGLLATILVIALNNARAKARDAKRVADIKQVQTALELFFNDKGRYPTASEFSLGSISSTSTNGTTTYMAIVPTASNPPDGSCSTSTNPFGYSASNDGASYTLSFCLGGATGSLAAGLACATPNGMTNADCEPFSCSGLGMVSYWEGESNASDSYGTHNGTLMNGVTFAPGKVGQAFSFDGVDDYINAGNFITNYSQFTFSFWTKMNSYPDPDYMTPFCQGEAAFPPDPNYFCFYTSTSAGSSGLQVRWLDMRTTISFGTGAWNHIVVTYDGSDIRQYLNSVLVNAGAYPPQSIGNANPLLFGKGYAYPGYLVTTYFSGLIDELAIFNRALTPAEIQKIYNNSLTGNAYCAY